MSERDDALARSRALAKPPRVLAPNESFPVRQNFSFKLGDYEEGGTGGWMALTVAGDTFRKFSVWLPVEAQQSRFLLFRDGEALPIAQGSGDRYVARFLIGGAHRVRVCADQTNGDVYVALPTEPEALEFIHWVRWQTWPEWVEAQQAAGYEVKVVSYADDKLLQMVKPMTSEGGWQSFQRLETGDFYLRRKKVAW